ncbi:MAG TPA: HPr-rel-A system PqqD family protein [Flavobacteriales bacterium]|jgi:PqqD family protein of HPr-rel-A system|nr:HPr-rel-A system PqqD family protein [Flavobacteriales bacterium]
MKVKKNVALSDSGFLFNPSSGESYSVNPIGQEIIKMLNEESSEEEIIATLLEKYNVERDTLEKDIRDFFGMLELYGVVKPEEA